MSLPRPGNDFLRLAAACLLASMPALAQDPQPDARIAKSTTNPTPTAPEQTFEFEIRLENVGEGSAQNLMVEDKLPAELAIPDGMVPTTSTGSYDAATQTWLVAELAPGAEELLVIPSVVQASPQPACIVNEASLFAEGIDSRIWWSQAAIRAPGIAHCVDLSPGWIRPVLGDDFCGGRQSVRYELIVQNLGPDDADDVTLTVTETSSFKLSGFSIESAGCSGLQCHWDTIPAGEIRTVYAESADFDNRFLEQHSISLEVTTADEDFVPDNDIYTATREIASFQTDCPDYGIPNPLSPGAGGCFIATAAYGTPFDSRIDVLRDFRDRWLMPNALGRRVMAMYYDYSPPLADYIAPRPRLRAIVRALLVPVLWLATYPVGFLLGALASITLLLGSKYFSVLRRSG